MFCIYLISHTIMITPTIVFSTPIAGKNSVHKGSLIDNDANKVTRHKSPVLYWEYLTTGFKILFIALCTEVASLLSLKCVWEHRILSLRALSAQIK